MVVVCVVYCDSDLTALLYLLFVFMCAAVRTPCMSKCDSVMTEEEMQRL